MIRDYNYSIFEKYATEKTAEGLKKAINGNPCVFLCVGSVKVTGDSLAPLVGTMLRAKGYNGFVYGTLGLPLTAKESNKFGENIKKIHPDALVVAIDSAVGESSDIGDIRIISAPLAPGLAVGKNLNKLGDISLLGVVSGRGEDNFNSLKLTEFALIGKMAEAISDAIIKAVA